jgi:hypothetical protein
LKIHYKHGTGYECTGKIEEVIINQQQRAADPTSDDHVTCFPVITYLATISHLPPGRTFDITTLAPEDRGGCSDPKWVTATGAFTGMVNAGRRGEGSLHDETPFGKTFLVAKSDSDGAHIFNVGDGIVTPDNTEFQVS